MSSLVRQALISAGALALCVAMTSCSVPDAETDPTVDAASGAAADTGGALAGAGGDDSQIGTLIKRRNATIKTSFDTYIVRDVRFETGEGFGSDRAIMGFYNGTVWQFELRFIQSIEILGKIEQSEALSAPDNYFVRDETDLRKTFRTWVTKTDGETVEFIVRINAIRGSLEQGGPLQLSIEELETLRRIDFF